MPLANEPILNRSSAGRSIATQKTTWGFVMFNRPNTARRDYWGEVAALIGTIGFGAAAYGQWLWPGVEGAADLLPFKIGSTVIFFVLAASLYQIARKGLSTEVQINTESQGLGLVRRNKEGYGTVEKYIPFGAIESLYIKRAPSGGKKSGLYLKVRSQPASILIARATVRELEPVLERMRQDCQVRTKVANSATRSKVAAGGRLRQVIPAAN